MKKLSINMLSIADIAKGQGVGSAYQELIKLLDKYGKNDLNVVKNRGLNYDVLHIHTVNPSYYIKKALSKGTSLTYVHFLPDTLSGSLKLPKLILKVYTWWAKRCYLKSDYLVVVNPSFIDALVDMGYPKERIFYVPNFVSSDNFYKLSDREILKYRKKYKFKKDSFIAVCVGQLHRGKGALDFFDIARNNPDIDFLWIGGFTFGKLMEGYQEIKDVYDNPPKNLHFSGIVDRKEVNILLNISDVFFFPSYSEGFPLAILEAINTEKPLVLRDLDIYKDIYFDNYLKGVNNKEFTRILRELKDNKELYNKYVNRSKNLKEKYSEKKVYKKWLNLYRTISKK